MGSPTHNLTLDTKDPETGAWTSRFIGAGWENKPGDYSIRVDAGVTLTADTPGRIRLRARKAYVPGERAPQPAPTPATDTTTTAFNANAAHDPVTGEVQQ